MGVVTASSSARTPLGLNAGYPTRASLSKRSVVVSFKNEATKTNVALIAPREPVIIPLEGNREDGKSLSEVEKHIESIAETFGSALDLDYNEAAAKLEYIYKRSPETEEIEKKNTDNVVRSKRVKQKRLSLEKRIALKTKKDDKTTSSSLSSHKRKQRKNYNDDNTDRLVRDYSTSTDLVSFDWKKMKIPPVLPSTEHAWLFTLMQPMKEIFQVRENLQNDLGREVTHNELAKAMTMGPVELRKELVVGHAARNKLIRHNLRLVLFVMNKYFQDFGNGPRFQDLCQAGVKGLITAIDRFEPKRKLRLSTYSLFWIRHAIIRSMTLSSFTKVSFGLDSVRVEIQRARLELSFELQRLPTNEEIVDRVGISLERFHEVMRVSKPVSSLHARHAVTQEEFINGITNVDSVEGDKKRQPALLRLALDDVLDSLKPKESLVIRQRYGLDGKGDRTLGEIAGNLNISREMVRKHEVKALMKLKHPARVDYLRRNIFK